MLCDRSLNPLSPHQILACPSFLLRPPLSGHQAPKRMGGPDLSVRNTSEAPTSPLSLVPALPSPTVCPHPSDPREASRKQSPEPLAKRGWVEPEFISSIACTGLSCPTCLPLPALHKLHPKPGEPSESDSDLGKLKASQGEDSPFPTAPARLPPPGAHCPVP